MEMSNLAGMRFARGALAVGLAAIALVGPGAANAERTRIQHVERVYSFDGTGTGVLVLSGSVETRGGEGFFAVVTGDAPGRGKPPSTVFFPTLIDVDMKGAHTYGAVGHHDLCPDPSTVCRDLGGGEMHFTSTFIVSGQGPRPAHVRYAIALRGAKVTLTEELIRWERRALRKVTRVTDDASTGGGVSAFGASAGTFVSTAAPAGRRGSIAIAAPPCEYAGAGAAILTGPGTSKPAVCPTDEFAAVTKSAGEWKLSGPAAGLSGRRTRLLVLDF